MSRGHSLPIDVRIAGIGRIKKRSGVRTKAERDDLVAMLRLLPKQGHVELVSDVQTGRRRLLEVYAHFVAGTLAQLHGPQDDQPLEPLLNEWLETAQCADGTRQNRRDAFRAIQPDGRRTYRLRDLPTLLHEHRKRCEAAGTPRAFNIARTCVQAFLRDTLGKRKPLALEVAEIPMLKERKRGRAGLSLAEAITVRDALSSAPARAWWSMCLTGMGPKEFWVDGWRVEADRIHIAGVKAIGRSRDVPLIETPLRPELTRPGFVSALRRLSERRLREALKAQLDREPTAEEFVEAWAAPGSWRVAPYMARKTFARWMEDAGIPRVRREVYLGHGTRDVGDLYERYDVASYLREDALRMRDLLPHQGLRMAR